MESNYSPGQIVDQYRIIRQLGSGGMGIVYEAEELVSERRVALKILQSDLKHSEEALERFRREAEAAAAISHEHCVFLLGTAEIDGAPAIAMELVEGETLEDRVARTRQHGGAPIPVETAMEWMLQILDGLEAAHRAGVIHRDVKPSNCFITNDGIVKVGDFGLSRLLEPSVHLTQSGQFIGSPLFAAPEQIKGDAVSPATDVYSAGATLFTFLTGRPPFDGQNIGSVLARILGDPPPLARSMRPEIPAGLDRILQKALAKNAKDRYASILQFRRALEPYARQKTGVAAIGRRTGAFVLDHGIIILSYWLGMAPLLSFAGISMTRVSTTPWLASTWEIILTFGTSSGLSFLYFFLFEWKFGWTPGKWLLGQAVIGETQIQLTAGAAALRTLVFHGTIGITTITAMMFAHAPEPVRGNVNISLSSWSPFLSYILLSLTARKSNGYRGIHEFLSRTRVVERSYNSANIGSEPLPELKTSAGAVREVGPYQLNTILSKTDAGELWLAHDPRLKRNIWIFEWSAAAGAPPPRGTAGGEAMRVRWLARREFHGKLYDTFEARPGATAADYLNLTNPLPWRTAVHVAASMADALAAGPLQIAPEEIWISTSGEARIAPCAIRPGADGAAAASRESSTVIFRKTVSKVIFGDEACSGFGRGDAPIESFEHAREIVQKGGAFTELRNWALQLRELASRGFVIKPGVRLLQLFLSSIMTLVLALGVLPVLFLVESSAPGLKSVALEASLRRAAEAAATSPASAATGNPAREVWERARDSRLILIRHVSQKPMFTTFSTGFLTGGGISTAEFKQMMADATAAHPEVTENDYEMACDRVTEDLRKIRRDPNFNIRDTRFAWQFAWIAFSVLATVSVLLAALLRCGVSMMLVGFRLRTTSGPRASMLRAGLRALIVVLPTVILLFVAHSLDQRGMTGLAGAAGIAGFIIYFGGGLLALRTPARGPADWIARTRIVLK